MPWTSEGNMMAVATRSKADRDAAIKYIERMVVPESWRVPGLVSNVEKVSARKSAASVESAPFT